jgi:hypothetical protein
MVLYGCETWSLTLRENTDLRVFWSRSHGMTDGQSASMSRFWAHSRTCDQILLSVLKLSVICHFQSVAVYQYLHQGFTFHIFYSSAMYTQYVQSFFQSQLGTAEYALVVNKSVWGEHLDQWEIMWQQVVEGCIMRSFIICTLCQVQLEWSSQGGWDGMVCSTHGGKEEYMKVIDGKVRRKETTGILILGVCILLCVCEIKVGVFSVYATLIS